jgi:hypothetical protein
MDLKTKNKLLIFEIKARPYLNYSLHFSQNQNLMEKRVFFSKKLTQNWS